MISALLPNRAVGCVFLHATDEQVDRICHTFARHSSRFRLLPIQAAGGYVVAMVLPEGRATTKLGRLVDTMRFVFLRWSLKNHA